MTLASIEFKIAQQAPKPSIMKTDNFLSSCQTTRRIFHTERILKGFLSLFKPRFKILAYHSVNIYSRDPFELTSEAFQKQMQYLAQSHYLVLPLEKAFRSMIAGNILPNTVVITFDDGYANLEKFAYPILKNYNFPATVFLPFKYIGEIDSFSYQTPRQDMPLLDWPAIETSQLIGITYGSHTLSHRNLLLLDPEALRYELQESRRILKDRLRLNFYALAYPFGMFNENIKRMLRETNYDCALCFGNVLSNTKNTDPFEMKREKVTRCMSLKRFTKVVNVKYDFIRKLYSISKLMLEITSSKFNQL